MPQTEIHQTIVKMTNEKSFLSITANPSQAKIDSKQQYQQTSTPPYENLIEKINKRILKNEKWYSLEFFPPKTQQGASNLIAK